MDVPDDEAKRALYERAVVQVAGLLEGEVDAVARMAGVVAVLHGMMPHFYWTGFYRVMESELVIGPYQGTPGCLRIGWGRGVCGAAWKSGKAQVVPDVHDFPGHIACDAASASEIVIPVMEAGRVVAVLDVDGRERGAFGQVDETGLVAVLGAAGW